MKKQQTTEEIALIKPKRKNRSKYDWDALQKKDDFFVLPKDGSPNAVRVMASRKGLSVSVGELEDGGYICDLLKDRKAQ